MMARSRREAGDADHGNGRPTFHVKHARICPSAWRLLRIETPRKLRAWVLSVAPMSPGVCRGRAEDSSSNCRGCGSDARLRNGPGTRRRIREAAARRATLGGPHTTATLPRSS
ncbi:hypothetical protein ACFPM0_25225 [Pseudonocardia sulfidoxydans]|uniref:hypothetical protein n=1 Tax=Pseudonocardia sulfidoxydans TaxID=54011 RepID=UPI0036172CA6